MDSSVVSFTPTRKVGIIVRDLSISAGRLKKGSSQSCLGKFVGLSTKKAIEEPDLESNGPSIKHILHKMSFDIPASSMTCIIGGSGSGKTTLLNCLSGRKFRQANLNKTGSIHYNNNEDLSEFRHAYVIQTDILSPNLTCFETLMYAAELKLPKLTSKQQRQQLIHEIILQLGLKECKDTCVGDSNNKGLSGGEKRRLSVALQLISNPSVLFLDEPTTGLDSYNALLLCQSLKNLAKTMHKTIIMSIHQPRADIFKLFDNVLILSKGHLCYGASYDRIFPHFVALGHVVPEIKVNPADFYIDITSVDTRNNENEMMSMKRVEKITDSWKLYMAKMETSVSFHFDDENDKEKNIIFTEVGRAPLTREVSILVKRNFKLQVRDPISWGGIIFEALFLGLICGWLFFKPENTVVGVRSIEGSLYSASSLQSYLCLLYETYRLCEEDLKVFDRERMEGCVSILGWLTARRISKFVTEDFIIPLVFSITTYFMFGLRLDNAQYFFRYFAGILISHLNTIAFATLAASLSREVSIATLIANLNFTFQSMNTGMFANVKTLPVYVRWCKYIAYVWYTYGYLLSNEFSGRNLDCNGLSSESCVQYTGKYILNNLGFPENWIALPICVLLAFAIVHYIIAGIVLQLRPVDVSMAVDVKPKFQDIQSSVVIEVAADKEEVSEIDSLASMHTDPITVVLKNISINVSNSINKSKKEILSNVSAKFLSGELNIIMGPSGSGKTSLLNFISGRLSSTLRTKYETEGIIYLDSYEIHDANLIKPVCSYVVQEDNHLLSCLSVRETMRFAATLRLAHTKMSALEREITINDIILQMGLRDCADTLVGNDWIKGISGGEKRRLSIAIQLITSPKILFLDEPTSGLDSFTASSIIECLKKLTTLGTTVIMTIHQPRSLDPFGSILLLAKGGRVAFNGTEDALINHFESIGFEIPKLTNLSDFVIDLISYNTSNEVIEQETRATVNSILDQWQLVPQVAGTIISLQTKSEVKEKFKSIMKVPAKFSTGYIVMLQRQMLGLFRDRNILIARATQVVGFAVILSLFFARLKHNAASIQNRLGVIQMSTSLYFTGMLNNLAAYPKERDNFYEEFNDDVIDLNSFFFSYLSLELPFEIVSALIYAVFMMFVIGFQTNASLFFTMFYAVFLIVNAGESLGISFNTLFDQPGFALVLISILCSIGVAMAGLLAMTLDSFLKALNYVSPLHYSVMLIADKVFTPSLKFYCTGSELLSDGSCLFTNGQQVKEAYDLEINLTLYFILFSVVSICHRIISWLSLKLKLKKRDIKKLNFN